MHPAILVVVLAVTGATAAGPQTAPVRPVAPGADRPAPARAVDARADAYFQFMVARRLQDDGDDEGAVAASRTALDLDPSSAVVRAELAGLLAKQGDLAAAKAEAEAGLLRDAENSELHRILGMMAAEDAATDDEAKASTPDAQAAARRAIAHFDRSLPGASPDAAIGTRMALGRLKLQVGDHAGAIATLRQLVVDAPGFPQAVALLADAYNTAGRSADALALLKDAAQRDPAFHASLGQAYEKAQQWREAAAAFANAVRVNPRDAESKIQWALALLNTDGDGDAARARDLLLEVTKVSPGHGWALFLLARAQRATGDLDGAERTARRLLVLNPSSAAGANTLAQVLAERRAWQETIDALGPVVDKLPKGRESDQAVLLVHLGVAYGELGRATDAVAALERARTLDPDDALTALYLGQALNASKRFDRTLAVLRPIRATRADDVHLARIEADALLGLGRVDEGAAVLRTLTERDVPSAESFQALAEYWVAAGRTGDSVAVLRGARRRFPDDLDVLFQLGATLERQKKPGDAERVFREVLARDPAHAQTLNYLGYMLAERGERLDEALALVTRAVDGDPHNGAYLDSLGWVYFRLGRYADAEAPLKAAAAQLPRDSVVQNHWGDLLARLGRTAEAVAAWKLALAGDGESIDRAEIEKKIRQASPREP